MTEKWASVKEVFKVFPNPHNTSGQRNAVILTESLHVIVVSSLLLWIKCTCRPYSSYSSLSLSVIFHLQYSELWPGNTGLKLQHKNNVSCLLTCMPCHASRQGQYFNVDLWWVWCLFCYLVYFICTYSPSYKVFYFYEWYVSRSSMEAS